mgnify:CR=1 FL=1
MHSSRVLLSFVSTLFLLTGCGSDYVYERTHELPGGTWAYADTLSFEFEVLDTATIYNLWLTVAHADTFRNQNIYTQIKTHFPNGEQLEELLSLELAGEFGGWNGDCRGGLCELRIPIQTNAFFNQPGAYKLVLEQYMRRDSIIGIEWVGFGLEETGQRRSEQ